MNRTEIKIEKDVFEEVMYTDFIEWGTLLDDKINDFWLENDEFRNNLAQVKIPKQLDSWFREFTNMYRKGKLSDDVENAMYEFLGITPKQYIEKEITKAYEKHEKETVKAVNKVLDKLNKKGVVLLEFYGYSTKDEDIEQDQTYQEEYDFLFDTIVNKIEQDLNTGFINYGLSLVWFLANKDNTWCVLLRTDNNDYYIQINDILTGNEYLEQIE
ncbi:hypothetical protein B5E73_04260 [Ligilactobacillus salivarius]|uniref:hypothetical protein n=1 Tax=Ligilactobacillus salivarius TaxID=1624 RepID=UPI000B3862F3|nr:hypothetical protein [Ligilactobacillus salivarius]OUQ31966.1 hypothetical protein B5E73_04260 [Ligilactobacillus salivarius]